MKPMAYIPYLASQYLQDTSVAEDVSQFDFSNSVVSFMQSKGTQGKRKRSYYTPQADQESKKVIIQMLSVYFDFVS